MCRAQELRKRSWLQLSASFGLIDLCLHCLSIRHWIRHHSIISLHISSCSRTLLDAKGNMQVPAPYKALGISLLASVTCKHVATYTSGAAFIGYYATQISTCCINRACRFCWRSTHNRSWEAMIDNWMGLLLCRSCDSLQIKIANCHCNQFYWGRVCCSSTAMQPRQPGIYILF